MRKSRNHQEMGGNRKGKRDKRGWHVYDQKDTDKLIAFYIIKSF
jgi:hypothetical protein